MKLQFPKDKTVIFSPKTFGDCFVGIPCKIRGNIVWFDWFEFDTRELLKEKGLVSSNGELNKLIKSNGLRLNRKVVKDLKDLTTILEMNNKGFIVYSKGKTMQDIVVIGFIPKQNFLLKFWRKLVDIIFKR